jgi:hypothetical protein
MKNRFSHVPAVVTRDPKFKADRIVVYGHREAHRTTKTWFVARGDGPGDVLARRASREKAFATAKKIAEENVLTLKRDDGEGAEWS